MPQCTLSDTWNMVTDHVRQRATVDETMWRRIRQSTMAISSQEAAVLYRAFYLASNNPEQATREFPFSVLRMDMTEFSRKMLDNGRWMEFLSDAIAEPDLDARAEAQEKRDLDESRMHRLHRARSNFHKQATANRMRLRQRGSAAVIQCKASLQSKYPGILWDDVAATPIHEWNRIQWSDLNDDEKVAVEFLAGHLPIVREIAR